MTCNIIATGSTGNAVQLGKRILLDCGVPYKHLAPILSRVNLVLLTHIHGDHFNPATIRQMAREHPLLRFGCCLWMVLPLVDCGVDVRRIDRYDPGFRYTYELFDGKFTVEPVRLSHDVQNCGYKITTPAGERAIYATDTGTMDGIEAKNFDLYLIEANHDIDELLRRERLKKHHGKFSYEERAARTHLSKQQADDWLVSNMAPYSEVVYLHEHQEREGDSLHEL